MNTTYFKLRGESEYEEVSEEVSESKPVFLIGIHSMQDRRTTTRHGITSKIWKTKRKHEQLFQKNLQIKGVY